MDRRNFLAKAAPLAAAALSTDPTTAAYSIRITDEGQRLDFTATRDGEVIGTASAWGSSLIESAQALSGTLESVEPRAAQWVIEDWLPTQVG